MSATPADRAVTITHWLDGCVYDDGHEYCPRSASTLVVRDGRYVPSMIDAMAALEFAREKAGSGCLASELAPLIQVGIASMHERVMADRPDIGSPTPSRASRVNPRVH